MQRTQILKTNVIEEIDFSFKDFVNYLENILEKSIEFNQTFLVSMTINGLSMNCRCTRTIEKYELSYFNGMAILNINYGDFNIAMKESSKILVMLPEPGLKAKIFFADLGMTLFFK